MLNTTCPLLIHMENITRVAVVQACPVAFDLDATLRKTEVLISEAAKEGAKLIVFPEAFLTAYPKGSLFGAYVGGRTDVGREEFRRYYDSAIDVPGPAVDALAKICSKESIFLVIGVVERCMGTLYNTVLFFEPNGYLGMHRKVMPTGAERLMWGFGDGSTLEVFPTEVGRIGAVTCWENYMPLLRAAMFAQGIEIYCAPTADQRETWIATMRHVACEGRCFVLSSNQFSRRSDYPADYPTHFGDNPETVISAGGSCIIDPMGNFLAAPNYSEECILYADLDPKLLAHGKYDFDVVGHYARPDIFQLHVNTRPQTAVTFSCSTERSSSE